MTGSRILSAGIQNWKLRLILSALLCIMGLSGLISMSLGSVIELSVTDKTIVGLAVFMVGTPLYLILSKLGKVDQYTIAGFLNQELQEVSGDAVVLVKNEEDLSQEELERRAQLEAFFTESPLYEFLPDKPVKQAYVLFLFSMAGSFGIWFLGS